MKIYQYFRNLFAQFKTNKMKSFLSFMIALAVFSSMLPSCKKTTDNPNPLTFDSATIMGFKDSTQLVKSIATQFYDSTGNMDTLNPPIYLYYDTLNKKIYFTAQPVSAPPTSNFLVYSYNNAGLITGINIIPGNSVGAFSNVYNYDAQNIPKSEITTYTDGSIDTVYFTKTSLMSGGYSLSFITPGTGDSIVATHNFDANNKLISKSELSLRTLNNGIVDSIEYDAAGNISKVVETNLEGTSGNNTYNLFEFASRDTKGNQLSNFNAILYNGFSNFPDLEDPANVDFGEIFNGFENYYFYQFTKYPSLSTKVYRQSSGLYITFNNNSQYDSKGRLIKYIMYNGDFDFNYAEEIDLSYYK